MNATIHTTGAAKNIRPGNQTGWQGTVLPDIGTAKAAGEIKTVVASTKSIN
jgi:hypothetical protein